MQWRRCKVITRDFLMNADCKTAFGAIEESLLWSAEQQGGYMTLAKFAMIFWHDLAAPILAGIITAAIVGWWRNRK